MENDKKESAALRPYIKQCQEKHSTNKEKQLTCFMDEITHLAEKDNAYAALLLARYFKSNIKDLNASKRWEEKYNAINAKFFPECYK